MIGKTTSDLSVFFFFNKFQTYQSLGGNRFAFPFFSSFLTVALAVSSSFYTRTHTRTDSDSLSLSLSFEHFSAPNIDGSMDRRGSPCQEYGSAFLP